MEWKSSKVSGKWKNELGSIMELTENVTGQISGTYTTAAEFKAKNSPGETADLVGYTNTAEAKKTTIAFCMAWKKEGSCSAFSGQLFDATDVIKTTWLLHSPKDCLQDNWEATCVGENTFNRIP